MLSASLISRSLGSAASTKSSSFSLSSLIGFPRHANYIHIGWVGILNRLGLRFELASSAREKGRAKAAVVPVHRESDFC